MKDEKLKILEKIITLKKLYEDGHITTLSSHEVNPGLDKNDRIHYIYCLLL